MMPQTRVELVALEMLQYPDHLSAHVVHSTCFTNHARPSECSSHDCLCMCATGLAIRTFGSVS